MGGRAEAILERWSREQLSLSYCPAGKCMRRLYCGVEMLSKQSNSASYRTRAAIYAYCAEQAVSPEAAAALHYLEEMWLVIAAVANVNGGNGSGASLDSDLRHLSKK